MSESNKTRHELLMQYVGDLQEQIGLMDWRIAVREEEPVPSTIEGNEAVAQMSFTHDGARQGFLTVSEAFWNSAPKYQRETIVHELLHCLTYDLRLFVITVLEAGYLPDAVVDLQMRQLKLADEALVDRLAREMHSSYRMPPIDKPAWETGENNASFKHEHKSPEGAGETVEARAPARARAAARARDARSRRVTVSARPRCRALAGVRDQPRAVESIPAQRGGAERDRELSRD